MNVISKKRIGLRGRRAVCLVLAFSLLFSLFSFARPTQAHAATTGWEIGTISLYDSSMSHLDICRITVDGMFAYCMDVYATFEPGINVTPVDAAIMIGQDMVTKLALMQDYVNSVTWIDARQKYFICQTLVWDTMENNAFPGGLRTGCGVSDADQIAIKNAAIAYANANKDAYIGHGTYFLGGYYQDLGIYWTEPILGHIDLQKVSSNPSITEGNSCYSLAGARYGVYGTQANAFAQTNRIATITTDSTGYGRADDLRIGGYWVREYQAPEGYALDDTIYYVTVVAKTTVRVNASDKPKNDPIGILLAKVDAETLQPYSGSDAASLADAQFTVKYYDAQYATLAEAQAATPLRTWVLSTDEDGFCALDPDYLVAGDPLYTNSAGDPTIPIGTFTVQETKAPTGYLLIAPGLPNTTYLFHITDDGSDGEFLYVYNTSTVREQIIRGDIILVKYQEDLVTTPDLPSEQKTPEAGVTFDLYASRDFTGTEPNPGAVPALSLVTDEDGVASSISTSVCVTQWPDGSYTTRQRTLEDAGALPYDSYLVVQRDVPEGYSLAHPFVVTVKKNAECHTYIIGNTFIPAAIRIEKRDAETGVAVPFPSKWQILSASTGEVITMTIHYPKTQVLDVFESDEDGWLLLPEMLPVGDYLLREIEAPAHGGIGYLVSPVDIPFSVTQRYEWDDPLVVICYDAPAKGQIELLKTDELSGEAVAGATYAIFAAADIYTLDGTLRATKGDVVEILVTDEAGMALSSELYLGSYSVKEIATPDGFAINLTSYPVELSYIDQYATINIAEVDAVDTPTTVQILKLDAITREPLAGITFAIEDAEGNTIEVTTDEDGYATYLYLPQGAYSIYEVETLPGYILSNEVVEITVDENGLIEGKAVFEVTFTNNHTKVLIKKTDIVTGKPVAGAILQVFPVDEEGNLADEPLHEWTTTDEPYLFEKLPQGDYVLRETLPPNGYLLAQDVPFTVEDTGDIQVVEMFDEHEPVVDEPEKPSTPNTPKTTLDNTGRDASVPIAVLVLLGCLGLCGGIYAFKNLRKKDSADKSDNEG